MWLDSIKYLGACVRACVRAGEKWRALVTTRMRLFYERSALKQINVISIIPTHTTSYQTIATCRKACRLNRNVANLNVSKALVNHLYVLSMNDPQNWKRYI